MDKCLKCGVDLVRSSVLVNDPYCRECRRKMKSESKQSIEQILKHIEELDKDILSVVNGSYHERWQIYTALMQAKSTALVALVQAEANVMNRQHLHYTVELKERG